MEAYSKYEQQSVLEVFSVGKECFIVFANGVIRLHFAMTGSISLHAEGEKIKPLDTRRSRKKETITLSFSSHQLKLYDSSSSARTLGYCEKVRDRQNRDIIDSPFDFDSIVTCLSNDSRILCEAIMDQTILPGTLPQIQIHHQYTVFEALGAIQNFSISGVGNVIKCEGLFESSLNPMVQANQISPERLRILVHLLNSSV